MSDKGTRGNRAKSALMRALYPPAPVMALAVPLICALMAWVFLLGNEESPLAYGAYVASAYLTTALCAWIVRMLRSRTMRSFVSAVPFFGMLVDDARRRDLAARASIAIDGAWAVANLILGIGAGSAWLLTLGLYYLVLGIMRATFLGQMRRADHARSLYTAECVCGGLLIVSVFILSGIVTLVMSGDGSFTYEGYLIYAVAAFTFYSLAWSIVDYAQQRRVGGALDLMNCRINVAIALVSLFSLETAMLNAFGTADDATLAYVAPIATGTFIALALCYLGAKSIRDGRRHLREMQEEG